MDGTWWIVEGRAGTREHWAGAVGGGVAGRSSEWQGGGQERRAAGGEMNCEQQRPNSGSPPLSMLSYSQSWTLTVPSRVLSVAISKDSSFPQFNVSRRSLNWCSLNLEALGA